MYGYIVKTVESGVIVIVIPNRHQNDEKSKAAAEQFIKDNILIKRCEMWGNETIIEFAIRLDELADELYRNKKNPNAN